MTSTQFYAEIAGRLSEVAGKEPAWTWRYVQGIQKGTIEASPRMDRAARFLLAKLKNKDPMPILPFVKIRALAGSISAGAWILSGSRTCKEPSCTINFVPRVPWQKYCPLHNRH